MPTTVPKDYGVLPGSPGPPVGTPSIAGGRETIPRGTRGSGSIAYLFLPRRSVQDLGRQVTKSTLIAEANSNPYRLLTYLPDIHPAISFSLWKNLRMLIPADGLSIVGGERTKEGSFEKNNEATQILEDLWESQPPEIGGLHGLQTTMAYTLMFTGMCCCEAVPGKRGEGVRSVWPVDPLTIVFKRLDRNMGVTAFQKQIGAPSHKGQWLGQYQQLDDETFFWRALDNWVDDPYGRPMYSTALAEVLLNLAIIEDIRDSIHANAWPRGIFGFNFEKAYEIAAKVYNLNDVKKAKDFVDGQFATVCKYLKDLNPDDWVAGDTNGSINQLPVPNFANLDKILGFLTQQLFWSMKELPVMMGSSGDASSESYVTQQMQISASTYETLRSILLTPLLKTANLHYRLLAKPYIAQAEYEKIRTSDALNDEEIKQLKIRNEDMLTSLGVQSYETMGINLTGSGPIDGAAQPPPVWEREPPQPEPGTGRNVSGEGKQEQNARTSANK